MPALNDRTFNKGAWARLGVVALGLLVLGGVIYVTVLIHEEYVVLPRMLSHRHKDPLGHPGQATTQIARLGGKAVGTLLADLSGDKPAATRSKSLEILSAIDDPRVVPALVKALGDDNLGIRISALAGIARTKRPELMEKVWPLARSENAYLRHRALVTLGLLCDLKSVDALVAEANKSSGKDQLLLAWGAGYAQRRAKLKDETSERVRPLELKDDAHAMAVHDEVQTLRAAFRDKGVDKAQAERLAELVTIDFGTWNLGHQISYQTVAVDGPMAVRGLARIDRVSVPAKRKDTPVGLKLKQRDRRREPAAL